MSHLVFVDSGGWIRWLACFVLTCLFVWFYAPRVLSIGKGKRGFVRRCNPPTKKHQLKVEISRKLLQGEFL